MTQGFMQDVIQYHKYNPNICYIHVGTYLF